ncbi:Translation machinery-associated protein 22 [Rhizoctonia solani AG-1 IB]|uniref:Translation machinery-associated protein 22 n=1 Tax=Thanatephorus cucumeris (strain AG1-IB / isolate 7/3/14) TaxID=1108050 RepID=M5BL61_THACB|nr:Translation machinery-associated protein 22 [Rhizoctonia solani AG-1 IB]
MPKGHQTAPAQLKEEAPVPSGSEQPSQTIQPLNVLYCSVCSFPPEYCEFGSSVTKCKTWLQETHSELFDKYYSEDALQQKAGALSLEAQAKLDKKAADLEAKADVKAEADLKKKKVTIKRIERNKRKHVTSIHGLEAFDVDLKKAAKLFAQKFATGSSVTKNPQGQDEIVVQGDVTDDIVEMIENQVGVLKGVPEDNVVCIEEKKKKSAE